ncbi:hypothetical protein N7462_000643 [Penicillium macrosclerotiorum]|uniref:uncharacterized protein n=1 Tax=Penicillium macrosclerotiorum TaxID=303699 RepID=UPI00254829E6|nr:uncharacterized protein N7462_000643 [Penicillium macrosclerotiorum]KAJ5698638.1 hypothetical protein N7462_000643 [Penicillium macrosclerotiorum]
MPSLKHILHKREEISEKSQASDGNAQSFPAVSSPPEITFLRSDTFGEEVITPPSFSSHEYEHKDAPASLESSRPSSTTSRRSFQFLHRSSRSPSLSSPSPPRQRRFSHLLHRNRSNSRDSSVNIPDNLPQIEDDQNFDKQEREAQWEKRATVLIQQNPNLGHSGASLSSPLQSQGDIALQVGQDGRSRSSSRSYAEDLKDDVNIQEAIRLHEEGELERSTQMFAHLADPNGANNPLSQVLYGLALRHGWGCDKNETEAVTYLSAAATNSAAVESEALRAGMKKGGVAKCELVLAIFELANCFRMGWGVEKDPAAARQYYETAANLGDTDAMDQVAWCYLEGFGGKKDKFKAARYYRLAEENGSPTVGNSWIWKEKYNPK